jgi:hypothetical protein
MSELWGRALIENRFGRLFSGSQVIIVNGKEYDMPALLLRMGLNFEDSKSIDVQTVSDGHYVVRYYDGEDQRIVAHEFDANFKFLRETRAHIAEWIGEEAYFEWFRHVPIGCPANF